MHTCDQCRRRGKTTMELQYDCISRYGLPCAGGGNGSQTGNISIIADTPCAVVMGRKNIRYSESN